MVRGVPMPLRRCSATSPRRSAGMAGGCRVRARGRRPSTGSTELLISTCAAAAADYRSRYSRPPAPGAVRCAPRGGARPLPITCPALSASGRLRRRLGGRAPSSRRRGFDTTRRSAPAIPDTVRDQDPEPGIPANGLALSSPARLLPAETPNDHSLDRPNARPLGIPAAADVSCRGIDEVTRRTNALQQLSAGTGDYHESPHPPLIVSTKARRPACDGHRGRTEGHKSQKGLPAALTRRFHGGPPAEQDMREVGLPAIEVVRNRGVPHVVHSGAFPARVGVRHVLG